MIPFIALRSLRKSGGSGNFPRLSYVFFVPALGAIGFGAYCAWQFWAGPAWDHEKLEGNIMYHDPINFLFSAMCLVVAAICILKFFLWHGPFKAEDSPHGR